MFVKVHVTVSPELTSTFVTGLPSLQLAPLWDQLAGSVSETEYPEPGTTFANVRVLESVGSASSSRLKPDGDRPPPAVNAKSCGSFGCASLTTTIWPRLRLVNVQVTVSPAEMEMFAIGLPSSHVAPVWSQPLGTLSASE